jgi:hypothetical protein
VIDIIESCDIQPLSIVYQILQHDNGLQILIPYLSRFLCLQVKKNLKNRNILMITISAIKCLVLNPYIVLDTHMEQLMPAILTTILGPKLYTNPMEDHWALRSLSAEVSLILNTIFYIYNIYYTIL